MKALASKTARAEQHTESRDQVLWTSSTTLLTACARCSEGMGASLDGSHFTATRAFCIVLSNIFECCCLLVQVSSTITLLHGLEGFLLLEAFLDSRHLIAAVISKVFLRASEHFTAFFDESPDHTSVGEIIKSPFKSFWLRSDQSSSFRCSVVGALFECRNFKADFSAEF
jgi:hypothetical protein